MMLGLSSTARSQDLSAGLTLVESRELGEMLAGLGQEAANAVATCNHFVRLGRTMLSLTPSIGDDPSAIVARIGGARDLSVAAIGLAHAKDWATFVIWYRQSRQIGSEGEETFGNRVRLGCTRAWVNRELFSGVDLRGLYDASLLADRARKADRARIAAVEQGFTDIHIAALSSDSQLLREGIAKGLDVDMRSKSGLTALHLVAANGIAEMVSPLLDAGASVDAQTPDGLTPLAVAMAESNFATAEALAPFADPNIVSIGQNSPLVVACQENRSELAIALLHRGANPNAQTVDAYPVLHVAASNADVQVVRALVMAGASIDAVGPNGLDAAGFARSANRLDNLRILESIQDWK